MATGLRCQTLAATTLAACAINRGMREPGRWPMPPRRLGVSWKSG
jgi:hypothetical protein